ncbi:hypothetical protein H634G_04107 [Metarhizium anisopliae BRIP 53293]|uniref:Uncharacterized protein n=1 Tax=Metarhizium anisopliae BRIP 53293 TaxID=1291518 RepID=A0A0D9P190_METAN|nr:hypothetical protein H634G_04107 [Metarhizium anisopliae BRIP 53293]KJK95871.1 hypothetical protein H633G_00220 [Metarhizium anisopliae BRIP 53284]
MASTRSRPKVSLLLAVPLSTLLFLFALFAFTGVPRFRADPSLGVFSLFRTLETGTNIIDHRKETAPRWLYHGLHAGPAMVWCVAIPLQHIDGLRMKWPIFHRINGYTALTASLIQSISGVLFLIYGYAYTHQNLLHIHYLCIRGKWIPPFLWPTFEAGLWVYAPIFVFTLARTVQTARSRNLAQHRKWAVLHTIAGYVIAINRLNLTVLLVFGDILTWLPARTREFVVGSPSFTEVVDMEISAFAGAAAYAYVIAGIWAVTQVTKRGQTSSRKAVLERATES